MHPSQGPCSSARNAGRVRRVIRGSTAMNRRAWAIRGAAFLAGIATTSAQAQAPAQPPVSGMIVTGAPKEVKLEVKTGAQGEPILSATEFRLVLGSYYRFNFICTDAKSDDTGFHLEIADLLANSHLRVVSINQIEVYLQGQTFRAIECDRP